MFTGIIEATGTVIIAESTGGIMELMLESRISAEFHVDQSVCHNGVCLTVVEVSGNRHRVQLVEETLRRSAFGNVHTGDIVNLERAMPANGRFEGHIVQGHVDCIGTLVSIENGMYRFRYPAAHARYLVEKGSVCVDGVSLTVAALQEDTFSVAIIPYTLAHTTFGVMAPGDTVNLEFDILGKYMMRILDQRSD